MYRFAVTGLFFAAGSLSAPAAEVATCQSCSVVTAELRKSVPLLTRESASSDDKSLALGDALGSACAGYVFSGLEFKDELAESCAALLKAGEWSTVQTALLAGSDPATSCASVCAAVPEGERAPTPAAPKAAKKKAKSSTDGTVNDPAYKAALKKSAQREAKRKAAASEEKKKGGKKEKDPNMEETVGDDL